jgi:hypothetical protein
MRRSNTGKIHEACLSCARQRLEERVMRLASLDDFGEIVRVSFSPTAMLAQNSVSLKVQTQIMSFTRRYCH